MSSRFFFSLSRILTLVLLSALCAAAEMTTTKREVVLAVYAEPQGGEALWQERQWAAPDAAGEMRLVVGEASVDGVPRELLRSEHERWLEVQIAGELKQPRVLRASLRPVAAPISKGVTSGPVLYAIVVRSSATIGAVPRISPAYTLENSLITDDGSSVHIGGLTIASNGVISFAGVQTFPGTGVVQSVTQGNGFIIIGGTLFNPTVALDTAATDAHYDARYDMRYLQIGAGQSRVTGTCPSTGITAVNADGSVVCGALPSTPLTQSTPTFLEFVGSIGLFVTITTITTGTDGLGLIGYYDIPNGDLKVAHCSNAACTADTATPVDNAGNVGSYPSMALGSDGLGLITYSNNFALKAAHCNNAICSSSSFNTLDGTVQVFYSAVTTGSDGLGLIAYYDFTNGHLKTAHCNNVACSSATFTTVDSSLSVGSYVNITIGTDGLGLISYRDNNNQGLRVAHCNDVPCTAVAANNVDGGGAGLYTSIIIGVDGLGLISNYDNVNLDLRVSHCNNVACTAATNTPLDTLGDVGSYSSIIIGSDGLGLISYYDATNGDLKVAHCSNLTCSVATKTSVDSQFDTGRSTSIIIGGDGLGLISYHDNTNGYLKTAHCGNLLCSSFYRRGR